MCEIKYHMFNKHVWNTLEFLLPRKLLYWTDELKNSNRLTRQTYFTIHSTGNILTVHTIYTIVGMISAGKDKGYDLGKPN